MTKLKVNQIFERNFPTGRRKAQVIGIADGGRLGTFRFLDNGGIVKMRAAEMVGWLLVA